MTFEPKFDTAPATPKTLKTWGGEDFSVVHLQKEGIACRTLVSTAVDLVDYCPSGWSKDNVIGFFANGEERVIGTFTTDSGSPGEDFFEVRCEGKVFESTAHAVDYLRRSYLKPAE